MRSEYGDAVLDNAIHFDIAIPESQAVGLCIQRYAPRSQAALDIEGVAHWLKRLRERKFCKTV
jgi:cellulose biosynthesis protein BcsQ